MTAPLLRVASLLDEHGIPHMVAGSFASTFHGEPRTTHDIDLVIDPARPALDAFVASLDPAAFYVSPEAADEAWRRRGQFNVILLDSGWKVDLILRRDRPFSHSEFARREAVDLGGTQVFIATAEDTILAKWEWAKLGEAERQLRDVRGVIPAFDSGDFAPRFHRWQGGSGGGAGAVGVAELREGGFQLAAPLLRGAASCSRD